MRLVSDLKMLMDPERPAAARVFAPYDYRVARKVRRVTDQRVLPHLSIWQTQVHMGTRLPIRQVRPFGMVEFKKYQTIAEIPPVRDA